MKLIKTLFFLFLITFTTHSFAKSNEYYKQTLIHVLTECNSSCQKQVFEQEVLYKAINEVEEKIAKLKLSIK